jgi:hypothetical protein
MSIVVVIFNLKAGVEPERYEAWARQTDLPTVNALASVREFRVLRASGLMNGAASPYEYVELIELHSLEGLRAEVKSQLMQEVARQFREFAEAPLFIVTEPL